MLCLQIANIAGRLKHLLSIKVLQISSMAGGVGSKVNKKFVESMAKATHFSEKVRTSKIIRIYPSSSSSSLGPGRPSAGWA